MDATLARLWDDDIVPALRDYVAIPAVSPMFDPDWAAHGHLADAVEAIRSWCAARPLDGLSVSVQELPGHTPVVVCEVAGSAGSSEDDTVLLYGHLDKQPPMDGWSEGLGPWTPVLRDGRLYGRGGADDGYAAFAALGALEAVQRAGGRHARCVLVIEASEESGSPDLPAHIDALVRSGALGEPSLVVALDSGCATYDRLWVTTSLRGLLGLVVSVDVLTAGVHSGSAGGAVPSSFRILRHLLDRVEDSATGELLLPELYVDVPATRVTELTATAEELGGEAAGGFPVVDGLRLQSGNDPAATLLARTWQPALGYVGGGGLPPIESAGNVLRPSTSMKLSFRLPPTCDVDAAGDAVVRALTHDVPHDAVVRVDVTEAAIGWNAAPFEPWLASAMDSASQEAWGKPARAIGEGGSIPFMAMLGERFPSAQFLVTGVVGPGANAHGPDEFLDVGYATSLTSAVATVLDAHARR